jgi:hypothetical protein
MLLRLQPTAPPIGGAARAHQRSWCRDAFKPQWHPKQRIPKSGKPSASCGWKCGKLWAIGPTEERETPEIRTILANSPDDPHRLPGNWPAMQRAPSGIAEPVPAGCAEQVGPQQGRAAGPCEIARRQDPGPLEAEAHKAPRAPPGLRQSWHPPADGSCSGQMPLDLSDRLLGQVLVDLGDDARAEVGVKQIPCCFYNRHRGCRHRTGD